MNPEKEIVNLWLNRRGFFTVGNINAGRNRIIDILAIKQGPERIDKIWHVELHCSLSSPLLTERERLDLSEKFFSAQVTKKIKSAIRNYLGMDFEYDNVLVSTIEMVSLEGIDIVSFDDILVDVLGEIDRQNYRDYTVRTMQLLKYLVLRRPAVLKEVVGEKSGKLLLELLSTDSGMEALQKKSSEPILIEILKGSSLSSSEKFGKLLVTEILSKRARSALLKELIPKAIEEQKDEQLEKFI